MISELENNDLVILSRYAPGGNDERSKLRVFSSKAINLVCRIFLDASVKDYTSSLF